MAALGLALLFVVPPGPFRTVAAAGYADIWLIMLGTLILANVRG